MPTDQTPKQLISQRIKDASNILVTVSRDPSVDELSAALALTLLLDKMDKVATAVVSGKIPPAIGFLEPGKTFDSNVDGLRDFIIALDKSKADRLRYKVEDDVVRVFITPYKTTITEDDLTFSQGDFNVDLVVAFGVDKREDLDTAITAHGRILHDATVVTIDQIPGSGSLGEVDWSDTEASSLSEMLMSLTESLQSGIIDEPIATAILTGLVSATDRFRNDKTTPKVMTMAAQLMAAGANQQLIAEKLEEAETVTAEVQSPEAADKKDDDGVMKVDHDKVADKKDDSKPAEKEQKIPQDEEQPQSSDKDALSQKAKQVAEAGSAEAIALAEKELAAVSPPTPTETVSKISQTKGSSWRDTPMAPPSTGGTLNATTDSAEEAKRQAAEDDKNRVILSHDAPTNEGAAQADQALPPVLNATTLPNHEPTVKDIFAAPPNPAPIAVPEAPTPDAPPATVETPVTTAPSGLNFEETPLAAPVAALPNPTLAELEAEVNRQAEAATAPEAAGTVDSARAAVDAVFNNQPFNPGGEPLVATGAQPLGDINHEIPQTQTPEAPAVLTDNSVALPPPPPVPADFTTLPPMPPTVQPPVDTAVPDAAPPLPAAPTFGLPEQQIAPPPASTAAPTAQGDLSQFKLPGQ